MPRNPDKIDYSHGFPEGFEVFASISDPRDGGHTLHHFGEILFIAFAGVLCGVRSDRHRRQGPAWQPQRRKQSPPRRERLGLRGGNHLGSSVCRRKNQRMERSDIDRSERDVPQRGAPGGAHQITAIPELLEMLNLKGAIITIDAMGTQRAIAEKTVNRGGDYILSVKGHTHGRPLHDSTPFGQLSPAEILIHSSIIGMAKIGVLMGDLPLFDALASWGLTKPCSVGSGGATSGMIQPPARWSKLEISRIPIGHGCSISLLQIVRAYTAIFNDGKIVEPHLTETAMWAKPRAVLKPETAHWIREVMTRVVEEGTGHSARIEGFHIAGKTSVVQKLNPDNRAYSTDKIQSSFVGGFKCHGSPYLVAVWLDEPKREGPAGGIRACVDALDELGEKERFEACRKVMERMTNLRRDGWLKVQQVREQLALCLLDPRRTSARNPVQG